MIKKKAYSYTIEYAPKKVASSAPKKSLASDSVSNIERSFQIPSGFSLTHVLLSKSQLERHSSDIVVFTLLNVLRLA
jgi:hypothetical protein